jgi:aldehyde:ferredoxin oxidoreductase
VEYSARFLEEALGEAVQRDRRLNRRFGLRREDDTLPERFRKEPLREGPTKGSTVDIERMVEEYYRLHGWEDE